MDLRRTLGRNNGAPGSDTISLERKLKSPPRFNKFKSSRCRDIFILYDPYSVYNIFDKYKYSFKKFNLFIFPSSLDRKRWNYLFSTSSTLTSPQDDLAREMR